MEKERSKKKAVTMATRLDEIEREELYKITNYFWLILEISQRNDYGTYRYAARELAKKGIESACNWKCVRA